MSTSISIKSTLLAVSALVLAANAHITMKSPVPYSADKVDSGPINAAQWPCKHNLGYTVTKQNAMKVGEKQTVTFAGTANHGGGSCQLAITTDKAPNANSVFKVIQTMEGGCPASTPGEESKGFEFVLPASVPNGDVTFAWTWFAKMSGAPEMYMNCAPVTVTGGASDTAAFNALPDMFVANVGTGCTTDNSENISVKIPNPGSVVVKGPDTKFTPPKGNCGKTGTSPPVSAAPSAAPSASPSKPAPSAAPSKPASSAAPSKPASSAVVSKPAPTNTGVVAAPSAATKTTLMTVTAAPTMADPVMSMPVSSAPLPTGAPTTPGAGAACATNGAVVCNGASSWGLCNHGKVMFMPVAAGTTCSEGKIMRRQFNGRIARAARV